MGKIVFITGGDKGIGRGIIEQLHPYYERVIFTYHSNFEEAQTLLQNLSNTVAYQCDLGCVEQIQKVAEDVLSKYGMIDVLVNNAAIDNDATFVKMDFDRWNDVIQLNLIAQYHFTKFFLNDMINNQWGRIINITSIAGITGAYGKSNYAAAKAGVIGMTKSLALELARHNITVNAIAPGAISTDMLFRIPEKHREKILQNIPLSRFGTPAEVGNLVRFLVSEQADYITGQTIHINGGSYMP